MINNAVQNRGCLAVLLDLLGLEPGGVESLPYRIRDDFLSPAESSFYNVLLAAIGGRAIVCPKVRLADLFFVAHSNRYFNHFNRIAQRHVDFLLCTPKSLQPILGIELDDGSHSRAARERRDEFAGKVFQAAKLPLLRVAVKSSYNTIELSERLAQYFNQPSETKTPHSSTMASVPLCPKCGVPMIVRTASRGGHLGNQFYGCRNYPRCHETLAIA